MRVMVMARVMMRVRVRVRARVRVKPQDNANLPRVVTTKRSAKNLRQVASPSNEVHFSTWLVTDRTKHGFQPRHSVHLR